MALIVLGIAVAIYLGICVFYFIFQERLLFVALGKKNEDAKINLAADFTEIFLDTPDDGRIHILHIKTVNPRGCILYFHGNTGGNSRWGAMAEELTSFGFDVFLPDYRGYGKSRGKRSEEILFNDALCVYQELKQYYPEEKICVYGRSLGSGLSTWLGARTNPKALVLETPYLSMVDVAERHLKIIPVRLFLKFQFRSDLYIPKVKCPILIAHGTKDKLVPYKSALALYNCVKEYPEVLMLTVPGGKHGNLNGFPLMRSALESFFDEYFPR